MNLINKIIDKCIELFQSFLKSVGIWETFSELAYKFFG